MRITDVESVLFTALWGDDPAFPRVPHSAAFVRVHTDEGLVGIGEPLLGYFIADAVPPLVDFFRPLLVGRDPAAIKALWREMYAAAVFWGRAGAGLSVIGGIEMALWDLRGKALGVPVVDLLGGKAREQVPLYASGGPSLWPPERTVEKVLFYRDRGYRAAKVSTGYYIEEDVSDAQGQRRLQEKHLTVAEIAPSRPTSSSDSEQRSAPSSTWRSTVIREACRIRSRPASRSRSARRSRTPACCCTRNR